MNDRPEQLPLPVLPPGAQSLDSFFGRAHREVVARLDQIARATSAPPVRIWLTGASGSGKSHLLAATCARAEACGQPALHSEPTLAQLRAACAVEGPETLCCFDDVERIAGDSATEAALMQLFNECRAPIVFASSLHPAACNWSLADLRSRVLAAEVFRLEPLDDVDRRALLCARADAVGLALPDEVLDYMLSRLPRAAAQLLAAMDRLDLASWRTRRRLTLPFVRDVLELQR